MGCALQAESAEGRKRSLGEGQVGLGSVTDLTDDEGDVLDGYTYDVFGAIRSQSGSSDNPWLFTGEQQDADSDL